MGDFVPTQGKSQLPLGSGQSTCPVEKPRQSSAGLLGDFLDIRASRVAIFRQDSVQGAGSACEMRRGYVLSFLGGPRAKNMSGYDDSQAGIAVAAGLSDARFQKLCDAYGSQNRALHSVRSAPRRLCGMSVFVRSLKNEPEG